MELKLYTKEFKPENFNLAEFAYQFSLGYAFLEYFDRNLLVEVKALDESLPLSQTILSGAVFNKDYQLKFRRMGSDRIDVVSDLSIDGFSALSPGIDAEEMKEREIFLWGSADKGLGNLFYEERIPYLFDYPADPKEVNDKSRCCIQAKTFLDSCGNPVWVKYFGISIKKINPPTESKSENISEVSTT